MLLISPAARNGTGTVPERLARLELLLGRLEVVRQVRGMVAVVVVVVLFRGHRRLRPVFRGC